MGYTHYHNTKNWNDRDRDGWKRALPIIKKIYKKYADLIQYECDSRRKPVANTEKIRFNGIGEDGHETFYVENAEKQYNDFRDGTFAFCKTARKPYDIVVCEVCLVLKAFCPHFALSSDGFSGYLKDQVDGVKVDGEWDRAMKNVREYGIDFHARIDGTHGGSNGKPNPYCTFEIVAGKSKEPALVK